MGGKSQRLTVLMVVTRRDQDSSPANAFLSVPDGGFEQFGQRHRAEAFENVLIGSGLARNRGRVRASQRHHGVASADEEIAIHSKRCLATSREAVYLARLGLVQKNERLSTDSTRRRYCYGFSGGGCNRCVEGVPPGHLHNHN